MRSLGGLLLLAGIGVGLFVYLPTPVDSDASLEHANRASAEADRAGPAPSRLVAFSPAVPLPAAAIRARAQGTPKPTFAVARPGDVTAARNGWETVVATPDSGHIQALSSASLKPADPDSRYKLVVELQTQLKRLGCYWGRIDGSWGPGSKYAMQTFTQRVNAALPTDEPDYVLLTLLQGHNGNSCGQDEPTVAQSGSSASTEVASANEDTLPWKSAGEPVFKPLANSVISTSPLPGRMTIGGPKDLPPVTQTYNAASPYQPQNSNVAALEPDAPSTNYTAPSTKRKTASAPKKYKRRAQRNGPGTPRYNLMLSLGGVY